MKYTGGARGISTPTVIFLPDFFSKKHIIARGAG